MPFPRCRKNCGRRILRGDGAGVREGAAAAYPLLATYGDEFAAFIAAFEPARELTYLADVARLEAARTPRLSCGRRHAGRRGRVCGPRCSAVRGLRVELHPSAEIIRSPHPIVTIWAMNSGECELAPIENWRGEDALVVRPHLDVDVRLLPPGGAAFLRSLAEARPLGEAAAVALADDPKFDLSGNLALLIGSGLVRTFVTAEPAHHGLS